MTLGLIVKKARRDFKVDSAIAAMDKLASPACGQSSSAIRRNQRGFSLVELVVVVAIVMLLISLLMPTLSATLDAARRIHCASNLRNLHMCVIEYANLKSGRLLPVFETDQGLYIPDSKVGWWYRHLTEGGAAGGLTSEGTKILDSRTAGKIIFCPSAPGRGWSNYTYGPCGINRNRSADTYQSVSSVSTPAGALLFADSAAPGDGNYTFNPNNRGVYVSTWQDLHYRHAGKANSVFLDGHVQSLTPEEAQARPAYFTSLRGF